jgi:hypothetical protein
MYYSLLRPMNEYLVFDCIFLLMFDRSYSLLLCFPPHRRARTKNEWSLLNIVMNRLFATRWKHVPDYLLVVKNVLFRIESDIIWELGRTLSFLSTRERTDMTSKWMTEIGLWLVENMMFIMDRSFILSFICRTSVQISKQIWAYTRYVVIGLWFIN